ncbi:MAG: hypothetical protein LPK07_11095 [Hymenobacteraceae bacterium]|nr:hypothetical protein [Hymenobacteraceae bacterium]MDX5482216.1 hypothetical protein [Hymenobacteraceae bacterium]
MSKKTMNILASAFISSSLLLFSCGGEYGENTEMPPESQVGETNETGPDELSGDLPGTGMDTTHINDTLSGDSPGTIQQ